MIPRFLLVAATLFLGCTNPVGLHPAVGRSIGPLPIVSAADPARPAPRFDGRVTLLNLWATWCPPCRRELPGLARLAGRLAQDRRFQLVAVACDQQEPADVGPFVARFLDEQRIDLDAWVDPEGAAQALLAAHHGFSSLPTSYLIGSDGRVLRVWVGYRGGDEADMARTILTALKDAAPAEGSPAAR
jgi:thiol-disulfide isomerase/thioredoxin